MASNDTRPPEQEPELSNPMSNRGFWIATFIMLAAVVLFLVFQNPPGARVLPYSELREKITSSAVERVVVQETVLDAYPTKEARKALKDEKKGGFVYWRASKPARDETLIPLLDRAKVKYEVRNGCDDSLLFFWVLPLLLFLFFFNTMMRRLNNIGGPSNPAMDFAKSRAKMYVEEGVGVVFDDVAGCDEAKEELGEVVDFLKDSEKITRLGGRAPRGVLLVGPPGTGKTLLARAVAGEAGVPFFNLSGSDFVEMFVGVGAARVRDLFEQAKAHEPCIIFIDELDAIGKSRSANQIQSNDEREQTLNALLVEMDGFDARSQVIILAATNRPEILDKALLRPGRFDRQVVVDRPDVKGREEILKVHTRSIVMSEDVDLKIIAAQTPGFVGADLANAVNEAALLAARAGKDAVELPDFQEAIERVVAGLEKKNRRLGDKEVNIVAYHESGHAIVAAAVEHADPVHKVSIVSRGIAALGYTLQVPIEDRYLMTRAELEDRIAVLLGGRAAEQIIFGDVSTGASNDLQRVTDIARGMVVDYGMSARIGQVSLGERGGQFIEGMGGRRDYSERTAETIDEEVREIVSALYVQTVDILEHNVELLHRMADTLKAQEVLDGDELDAMLASARRPEPGTPSPDAARDGSLP